MTDPDVDWSHLPDDPLSFFGLEADFERRDLKRAYTRLIRHYKPERYPDEFKRVRAAYDQLDERLRYLGGGFEVATPPTLVPDRERERAPSVNVVALLRDKGPAGTRTALRETETLDPRGWCHLALLEEVFEASPLALGRTLIEAILRTGGDSEPMQLLRAVIHEGLPPRDAATLVREMTALVRGPRPLLESGVYWYLTEPLWVDLVTLLKFPSFAQLLDQCTAEVGLAGHSGQLVLLTTLLRRAAFRAEEEWIDEARDELAESYLRLDPWHQEDVDLIEWLFHYRAEREEFRAGHELRETLDRALVAIVEGDEVRADRIFLEAQVACLDQREELFEAFPLGANGGTATELIHWYAAEVESRRGVEHEPSTSGTKIATEFAHRVARRSARTPTGRVQSFVTGIVSVVVLACVIVPWPITIGLGAPENPFLWLIPIATTALAVVGFFRGWIGRVIGFFEGPFERRLHRVLWREMTADFLSETHIPLTQVMSVIRGFKKPDFHLIDYVNQVEDDEALFLYSTAMRFAE